MNPVIWRKLPVIVARRILFVYGGFEHPVCGMFKAYMSSVKTYLKNMPVNERLPKQMFISLFLEKQKKLVSNGSIITQNLCFWQRQIEKLNKQLSVSNTFVCIATCANSLIQCSNDRTLNTLHCNFSYKEVPHRVFASIFKIVILPS